jgi:hypothetical protein
LRTVDGVTGGWYVRPCSEWRKIGRFAVTGAELRQVADVLRIKTYIDPEAEEILILEPMAWADNRFVKLRETAGWSPPFPTFSPPPYAVEVTVRVMNGRAVG